MSSTQIITYAIIAGVLVIILLVALKLNKKDFNMEVNKLVKYLGGKEETVMSYAGIDDIMMTCTSSKSRNYSLGVLIGKGDSFDNYIKENTVEGLSSIAGFKKLLGDDADLLKENLEVDIIFYEGEMLGMNLPDKIALKIVHTEPAVKGNTTSSAMKDATLETGKVIKVPLFIEEGEELLISSKDGKNFINENNYIVHTYLCTNIYCWCQCWYTYK